jgi:hypothetical protein
MSRASTLTPKEKNALAIYMLGRETKERLQREGDERRDAEAFPVFVTLSMILNSGTIAGYILIRYAPFLCLPAWFSMVVFSVILCLQIGCVLWLYRTRHNSIINRGHGIFSFILLLGHAVVLLLLLSLSGGSLTRVFTYD